MDCREDAGVDHSVRHQRESGTRCQHDGGVVGQCCSQRSDTRCLLRHRHLHQCEHKRGPAVRHDAGHCFAAAGVGSHIYEQRTCGRTIQSGNTSLHADEQWFGKPELDGFQLSGLGHTFGHRRDPGPRSFDNGHGLHYIRSQCAGGRNLCRHARVHQHERWHDQFTRCEPDCEA